MGLTVSRTQGQSLIIGDNVRVTVVEIRAGQVRLDVTAPHQVRVDRSELRAKKDAGKAPGSDPMSSDEFESCDANGGA
jgi:carbon storage regulator